MENTKFSLIDISTVGTFFINFSNDLSFLSCNKPQGKLTGYNLDKFGMKKENWLERNLNLRPDVPVLYQLS